MSSALVLLAILGVIGAFDTLYFHEWRARLPARPEMRPELRLHAGRDAVYVVIFATLPTVAWHGRWALALAGLLLTEVVLTMTDFVTEDRVRRTLGGLFAGERITHALMGIVYGAMLAFLVPELLAWLEQPTALDVRPAPVPAPLRWALLAMAAGIALHGLRDLLASTGVRGSAWPWQPTAAAPASHHR